MYEHKGKSNLSKEERLLLLREADISGNITASCRKFNVPTMVYYNAKEALWDEYLTMKEKENRLGIVEKVVIESNNNRMTAERKAMDTLMLCLEVIDTRLQNEKSRLDGDEEITEKLSMKEMTAFFMVAAPYVLKMQAENQPIASNLMQHHTYITNILNQQTLKLNGNKQNNDQRNLPESGKR